MCILPPIPMTFSMTHPSVLELLPQWDRLVFKLILFVDRGGAAYRGGLAPGGPALHGLVCDR